MARYIGITGSSGFVGTHLRFLLYEHKDKYIPILINKADFLNLKELREKLRKCNTVIHLAGLNKGGKKEIYNTNVGLTKTLLSSLNEINKKPKIIFLSSFHNTRNTAYGRSKKESEKLILNWGKKNKTATCSIVSPHIFGEFGKPYYNSAVATLAYELSKNKKSRIDPKAKVELLYVRDICSSILKLIEKNFKQKKLVPKGKEMKLTNVYSLLKKFRDEYFSHVIPQLKSRFQLNLFNTFRSHLYPSYLPINLDLKKDNRGKFIELTKTKIQGQTSFSTILPKRNVIRGNHYHTRKIERFCVVSGVAVVKMRKLFSSKILIYKVTGAKPVYIDIPTYYTHSLENIGSIKLLTVFWVNEIYNPNNPDTFSEPVVI